MLHHGSRFCEAALRKSCARHRARDTTQSFRIRIVQIAVRPFGPFHLGGRWTPDGTEDARLVLGEEDTALASEPGVRLLGREAGLFAYLVPAPAASAGRT